MLPLGSKACLDPFYWRNDYFGVEQWSRNIIRDHYVCLLELHDQHERFAETWDNNLRLQGFAEAFTDKSPFVASPLPPAERNQPACSAPLAFTLQPLERSSLSP